MLSVEKFLFSSDRNLCLSKLNLGYKLKDFSAVLHSRKKKFIDRSKVIMGDFPGDPLSSGNHSQSKKSHGLESWQRSKTELLSLLGISKLPKKLDEAAHSGEKRLVNRGMYFSNSASSETLKHENAHADKEAKHIKIFQTFYSASRPWLF